MKKYKLIEKVQPTDNTEDIFSKFAFYKKERDKYYTTFIIHNSHLTKFKKWILTKVLFRDEIFEKEKD